MTTPTKTPLPKTVDILQVDAFTDRPFAGNPAGVVMEADGLADGRMREIAAEMNVAETAFLSASGRGDADRRLRWFTPTSEVTYCGHATVASVHALVEAGRLTGDRIAFDTLGGLLRVEVERRPDGNVMWLEPPLPALQPFVGTLDGLVAAAGLTGDGIGGWAKPALTPEKDLLVPASGLAPLRALAPDMATLARLGAAAAIRGLCIVSREAVDPGSTIHSRFFAPHIGIPEDPVTGSVHSSIAVWLATAGLLPATGRSVFTAEQGDWLGRPGRLLIEVEMSAGAPARVRVGGRAVTVLQGRILS